MKSLNIRAAKEQDLVSIRQLYDRVTTALETGINYCGWAKGFYPTAETAQSAFDKNRLYLVEQEQQVVGSFVLSQDFEPCYEQAQWSLPSDYSKILVVHTLAVDPAHAGKGIGKKILDFVCQHGTSLGITSIRLDTYEKNLPAIALYEGCGFRFAGKVDLGRSDRGLDWFHCYEKLLPCSDT